MGRRRENRSRQCLKKLLSFCNVIFWFAGLGALGLGIWFYLILQDLQAALDYVQFVLPAYLLIISGGAVVIFGIIGCLAIFSESRCLLLFHCLCVVLVCGTDIFACVKFFMLNNEVESHIQYRLGINVNYKYRYDEDTTKQLDTMQQKFECCGINNVTDWKQTYYNLRGRSLISKGVRPYPASCCINISNCSQSYGDNLSTDIYQQGCLHRVVDNISWLLTLAGWSTLGMSSYLIIYEFTLCCFRVSIPQ